MQTQNPQEPVEQPVQPPAGGTVVTILFTDLASSTEVTNRLGDAGAQEVLRAHNTIVRQALGAHAGTEIKHTGDGIMASFPSAYSALQCAAAIQRLVRAYVEHHQDVPLSVHIGLNAGEPLAEAEDLYGTAVQLTRRICDAAAGGEVLVSDVVQQLAAGKGLRFTDRGRMGLKGFADQPRIWQLDWQPVSSEVPISRRRLAWRTPFRLREPRRAWVIVAGATLAAVIGTGVGLFLMLPEGESQDRVTTSYRQLATTEVVRTSVQTISGDCQAEDLVVRGSTEGTVAGDINGTSIGTFAATLSATNGCLGAHAILQQALVDGEGNTLTIDGDSFALSRATGLLEGQAASSQSDRAFGVITGGTGIYQDAAGSFSCEVLTVITGSVPESDTSVARANANCSYKLVTSGDVPPLSLQFGTGEHSVSVLGGSSERPATFPLVLVCVNNSDETLSGLTMRLDTSPGANVRVKQAPDLPFEPPGVIAIPEIPPGEVVRVVLDAQVLSSDVSFVEFGAVVEGEGLDGPIASDRLSVEVVE